MFSGMLASADQIGLPPPGDDRQLKRLCGRIFSQQLDRGKPLWEIWFVEGLEHDRFALVSKVHHCMIDGVSGNDLLQVLLSLTPEKNIEDAPGFHPNPPPSRVELVRDEAVGPAGPTTATRMDKFTDMMLSETGLIGMVGKAERGPVAIESIKKHKAAYLMAVGGAAYLVSQAIRSAKVIAFEELGMEAIYEFDVVDMPVTVAVDSKGESVHQTGPAEWKIKIEQMGL